MTTLAALAAFILFLFCFRLTIKRLTDARSTARFIKSSDMLPPMEEELWVIFPQDNGRGEGRPRRCRLANQGDCLHWVLPDGQTKPRESALAWRRCTDQIPELDKCPIVNPYDKPRP